MPTSADLDKQGSSQSAFDIPGLIHGGLEAWDCLSSYQATTRTLLSDVGGAQILDAGIETAGSLEAGIRMAEVCLAGQAIVEVTQAREGLWVQNAVTVRSDDPVGACLGGQYAGWPVSAGKFFAMASGPMRMLRGREEMLEHLGLIADEDEKDFAVGVLECDKMPDEEVVSAMAAECGVEPSQIRLVVAPVTSIAGCVQVVARSVETALHKLHALDFDVNAVVSATGSAPLPPPAKPGDMVGGIGRTNDAMLYGGQVTMWVDADDDAVDAVASKVPSCSSADHGKPFAEIFKQYDYDFYKVDPMLFSPAVITMHSLRSGRSWRAGKLDSDVLGKSFGFAS